MNTKKIARRERAAERFAVLPFDHFYHRLDCPRAERPAMAAYDSYLARKRQEARALGLKVKEVMPC